MVKLAPHIPQKRISGGHSKSQFGHFINDPVYKNEALTNGALRSITTPIQRSILQRIQGNAETFCHFLEDFNSHIGVLAQRGQEIPPG
jgi:hypothetical protein